MPRIRDEIVRNLWRGKDPFLASHISDGVPDLQGWGSQHHYLTDCIETRRPSIIVEVGVWKGASTIHMATRLRDLAIDGVVIAVDTWLGSWEHWYEDRWFRELGVLEPAGGIFATFIRNVRSASLEGYIIPLPLDSVNAAQVLRHFNILPDVIHIDGGHDYAAVMADLKQWWPLVKPGGLLIGDDYRAGNDWPGVKRAFDDFFRPLGLIPIENINEKCRVSKPLVDSRANESLSTMKRTASAVFTWRETRRLELEALIESESIGAEEQLERYVRFSGPNWQPGRDKVMDQIANKLAVGNRELSRDDVFGADGVIKMEAVHAALPGFTAHYLAASGTDEFERFELLPEFENLFTRFALPGALNRNMGKARGSSFAVYRAQAADLFLSPIGYQLFRAVDGIYWPAASTRAYPQEAMGFPDVAVDKNVVLVQDAFEGSNFSHFLFDWVPRIGHFLNAGLADPSSCIFVLGGIPSEFHFHVIQALCEIYSLSEQQFIFPGEPQRWHIGGSVYFFSDQKGANMHPAHMAHRRSIAIVREVCSRILTPTGDIKKIFVSRGDTPLRRIANEAEVFRELKPLGFVEIQLGSIPFLEQVKLMRGADIIVAPHGMGLTHIAFHERRPLIIELHNPVIGTDTYAFPAHALGFRYRAVLGTDLGDYTHHFNIPPGEVVKALLDEGVSSLPGADGAAGSPIRTKFMGGVQSVSAIESFDISPLRPNSAVYRHARDNAAVQPDNNCGWFEVNGLTNGAVYHCSCEVWLPASFKGDNVTFSCSGLASSAARRADPAKRDQWQTISISGTAIETLVNFVLRCDADAGSIFYTSAWRFGPGSEAD